MLTESLAALSMLTTTVQGPCPDTSLSSSGCYVPPPVNTVYVEDPSDTWTNAHELGHVADYLQLGDGERRRIVCHPAMKLPRVESPCGKNWVHLRERFADAFAYCALDLDVERLVTYGTGYGYQPASARQHENLCRLISRAVAQPSVEAPVISISE